MRHVLGVLAAAAALAVADPAAAQGSDVLRRAFTFIENELTIEVLADVPGTIHLTRGQAGVVEVAARAEGGFAAAGLSEGTPDRLNLTAVGAERVEYLVVVPGELRARIKLPDRYPSEVFGPMEDVATYRWESAVPGERPGDRPAGGGAAAPPMDALEVAYSGGAAPRVVRIPSARAVRTLTVRWEGETFRLSASRPLQVGSGDPAVLELRLHEPPADVVMTVPRGVTDFALEVRGENALVIRGGEAAILCQPVVDQPVDGGGRVVTFAPEAGRLKCRDVPIRRRKS